MKNIDIITGLIEEYYNNENYWEYKDEYRNKLGLYMNLNDKYEVNVLVNIMFIVREDGNYLNNEVDAVSLWEDNKINFEYNEEDMMSHVETILKGDLDIETLCG